MNPSASVLARSIDSDRAGVSQRPSRATDALAEKLAALHGKADRLSLSLADSAASLLGPDFGQQATRIEGADAKAPEPIGSLGSLDLLLDNLGTKLDAAQRHAERLSTV